MTLNSLTFIFLFFPLVATGYWLFLRFERSRGALAWLLASCVAFYLIASPHSLLVLLPSILFDYVIIRLFFVLPTEKARARTALIALGVLTNIGFLGYFKYKDFFIDTAGHLVGIHLTSVAIALPLGISFLIFQKIAFLSDVSAGKIKEINLSSFLLFTLFFPKAIAGPIVHHHELMPQLQGRNRGDCLENLAVGFCLFSIGLFKKCVIADGIAQLVPLAFPSDMGAIPVPLAPAWIGTLSYTFQLYFDFSGYSDMALGAARMLGVRLPMNFNSPLKAASMVDYWGRWHITLTRFLTWHIYIPLVRRVTRLRAARRKPLLQGRSSRPSAIAALVAFPTIITMVVSGVWHGAGFQFVVWGLIQGSYLTVNQTWRLLRPRFWENQASYERVMKPVGYTLTSLGVVFALVVFRADSMHDALSVLAGMLGLHGVAPREFQLLRRAGFNLDWPLLWDPLKDIAWLLVLWAWVTLLPNSLELLRRFQPALDFPEKGNVEHSTSDSAAVLPVNPRHTRSRALGIAPLISRFKDLGETGVPLNDLTAVISTSIFFIGATAIGRGGGFLYGGF